MPTGNAPDSPFASEAGSISNAITTGATEAVTGGSSATKRGGTGNNDVEEIIDYDDSTFARIGDGNYTGTNYYEVTLESPVEIKDVVGIFSKYSTTGDETGDGSIQIYLETAGTWVTLQSHNNTNSTQTYSASWADLIATVGIDNGDDSISKIRWELSGQNSSFGQDLEVYEAHILVLS